MVYPIIRSQLLLLFLLLIPLFNFYVFVVVSLSFVWFAMYGGKCVMLVIQSIWMIIYIHCFVLYIQCPFALILLYFCCCCCLLCPTEIQIFWMPFHSMESGRPCSCEWACLILMFNFINTKKIPIRLVEQAKK